MAKMLDKKSLKDAYGQEVWAQFVGKPSFEVIEREDGFITFTHGAKLLFQEYKDWVKPQKQAIKFAKGAVLDIGTGTGRVPLYLQKRGRKVTAIDSSKLSIKICKLLGVKDARVLTIDQVDRFKPGSFDTIVMFGNNFGLFESKKKAKILLKKLARITSPNALILAESVDPYSTKDPVHLAYQRNNLKRGRLPGQNKVRIRFRYYASDWFDYLQVSKKEMQDILKGTPWRVKRFFDSTNPLYVAVIEKR